MTDRLRGVGQVGQPDVGVPIPIAEARPLMETAAAAGFAVPAEERVVIARQVTEAEQERRERMEETAAAISEAVAIVRDLAAATRDVDVAGVQSTARKWVSAHPVSGDPA